MSQTPEKLTARQIRECFSRDYRQARDRFLQASRQQGAELQAVTHPERGAHGEPLTMDVAIWGERTAPVAMVLSSGLHGIEGFFGSAVQLALLKQREEKRWPQSIRLVLVHALNPWGFSHLRRSDEQNIDCNRNFLPPDFFQNRGGEAVAEGIYPELNALLNPQREPRFVDGFYFQAWRMLQRHGHARLSQAIAGGQYDFPQGLFFGGAAPSWTVQQVNTHWEDWIGSSERVLHFDLHTGLGRRGTGKCLINGQVSAADVAWLQSCLGEDAVEQMGKLSPAETPQNSAESVVPYVTRGDWGSWCQQRFGAERYLYGCLEFGTFPAIRILKNLRLENQAQHYSSPADPRRARSKRRLKRMFCPQGFGWKRKVVTEALQWMQAVREQASAGK